MEGRVPFRFTNMPLHQETSVDQWRKWVWFLVPQMDSLGHEGATWKMTLRSVMFGGSRFICPTTQRWTSVPT